MSSPLLDREPDIGLITTDVHVVSNREPYRHEYDGAATDGMGVDGAGATDGREGDVVVDRPVGGLTAGLDPVMRRLGGTWIAWGDGEADFAASDDDNRVAVPPEDPQYTLHRIPLSDEEVEGYYEGYANRTLWPLCHAQMGHVEFHADDWETYRTVNRKFAAVTADSVDDSSTVWFQDYHFALAPRYLRAETDALLMQFWHVPWPAAEVFRTAPHREALLKGLLANDLLGFHVPWYSSNFLECVEEFLEEAIVDWAEGRVHYGDRPTRVESFPLAVEAEEIRELAEAGADDDASGRFRADHGIDPDRRLVLGVDRLDYTKGIPERLAALEHLWETRPEFRGAFTYVQKGRESRQGIEAYRELQATIDDAVARVNDRFGTDGWQPVVATTDHLPPEQLYGLYRDADVALLTPLRDGMNLVAKEYVAAQADDDAALVLSEFAGAYRQLGEDAIGVNPRNTPETAAAIARGLEMDEGERRVRMRRLRDQVAGETVDGWTESVMDAAAAVAGRRRRAR